MLEKYIGKCIINTFASVLVPKYQLPISYHSSGPQYRQKYVGTGTISFLYAVAADSTYRKEYYLGRSENDTLEVQYSKV